MKKKSNKPDCPKHEANHNNTYERDQKSGSCNSSKVEQLEKLYLSYAGRFRPDYVSERDTKSDSQDIQGHGETILIAEDNLDVSRVLKLFLENASYRPIVVHNGKDALEIYREKGKDIALVILDLRMPVMTGQDCIRELLKIDPTVKVLALSGYYQKQEVMRQIGDLIKGFIPKPCRSNTLLKQARYAMSA